MIYVIEGPDRCGKSTFIRLLNRMNDLIDQQIVNNNIELRIDQVTVHLKDSKDDGYKVNANTQVEEKDSKKKKDNDIIESDYIK